MTTRTTLRLAVGLLAVGLSAALARGQVPDVNAQVAGCVLCHYGPTERGAKKFVEDNRSDQFIRLSESKTWEEADPHAVAFDWIKPEKNPVAKRMQELLSAGKPDYKVIEDARCLACHATDLNPTAKAPRQASEFVGEGVGVGCAACHGVQSKWQDAHYKGAVVDSAVPDRDGKAFKHFAWRTEKPAVKAAAGMRTLRDPQVKADLCASCHVGNPDEGKVVTHDLYAAGHPPLPPLELVTFMDDEPRHWGYPTELPFLTALAKKDPGLTAAVFHFKPADKDDYLTRHLAAGAMASLKAEMKLLEWEANRAAKDGDGLDYARFDCYSCHHDLKFPAPRQARGFANRVPGRPPLKAWVAALPGTVIDHAGTLDAGLKKQAEQFKPAWLAVSKAVTANPFGYGKGAEVAKAAKAVVDWTTDFNKSLAAATYSGDAPDRLLAAIGQTAVAPAWFGDTEAAMHLTWAYRSLEMARRPGVAKADALRAVVPVQVRDAKDLKDIRNAHPDWKGPIPAGLLLPWRQTQFANFDPKQFRELFPRTPPK